MISGRRFSTLWPTLGQAESRNEMSIQYCFGILLAIYYFVGRWTFARLDGDYAQVSMVEQPRFWLTALLVATALVIQSTAQRQARQFRPCGVDIATFVFLSYMLLTSAWAPDADLAATKAFELALILTVAMVLAASRSAAFDADVKLGFWMAVVAIGVSLGGLALLHANDTRAYAPGGGPNTFGRNMGLTAFGSLFLASRFGIFGRLSSIGVFAMAALLVVRCGSRGGLLSFGIASATYVITSKTSIFNKLLIIVAMSAATGVALRFTEAGQQAVDVFQGRIVEQTMENRYLSGRDDLWHQAIEMITARPIFGWGLDGFRANSWNYPHNILMEVAAEGGGIGLLLLLNVARAWWRDARQRNYRVLRSDLAALALMFTAAQTSGDLFDSRGVFLTLALSLPFTARTQRQSQQRPATQHVAPRPSVAVAARPLVHATSSARHHHRSAAS